MLSQCQLLCLHFIFIFKFIYYANLINYKVKFKLKLNSVFSFIADNALGALKAKNGENGEDEASNQLVYRSKLTLETFSAVATGN